MKNLLLIPSLSLLLFASCKKDEPKLTGNSSRSEFDYLISRTPGGDTLPFTNQVTFINQSTDAFSWLWDFGDASQSVQRNPIHTYGTGTSFLVKLTSVGKAGNNTSTKVITLASPCDFEAFSLLTGCGSKKWSLSPATDAIRVVAGTVTTISPANPCMTDDVYTFTASGGFSYDAKGKTFVNNSCVSPKPNATGFRMLMNAGGKPIIILDSVSGGHPFLGRFDQVVGNRFELDSISEEGFRATAELPDGRKLIKKFVPGGLTLNTIKLLLTGGSRKTWRLDSLSSAPITAGVEASPTQYYAGGPLAPCQKDDWYTFTASDSIYVECNGSTLQPSQGFSCGNDESFAAKFSFGSISGTAAGLAQINLTANNADEWIGILDRANENLYRILDITSSTMTLRSGNGTGTIHTLKFVLK